MPKQDTANHTKLRQFRLGEPTIAALNTIADRYHVDRTTAIKIAVHGFLQYEGEPKKKSKKSALPS